MVTASVLPPGSDSWEDTARLFPQGALQFYPHDGWQWRWRSAGDRQGARQQGGDDAQMESGADWGGVPHGR